MSIRRELALRLLTYPLTILFAMAAGTKVMKYATYRSYLHSSGLMGEGTALWVSIGLPLLELAVAALLPWPKTRRVGLVLSITLLPFYQYYIHYTINKAAFLPCGCLGALPITWEQHYILNITVLAVALVALQLTRKSRPGGMVQVGPAPDPEGQYGSIPNFYKRMLSLFRKILPALAVVAGLAGAFGFSAKLDPCATVGTPGYSEIPAGGIPNPAAPEYLGEQGVNFGCATDTDLLPCFYHYENNEWKRCEGDAYPLN